MFAINKVANSAYAASATANFWHKFMTNQRRCARLGIVLAQPRGYPQKKTGAVFCPRSRDNGKRDRCTGLAHLQVRAAVGKNAVVHIPCRLLLLRLCIYRQHKKKTEGQLGAHPRAGVVIWTGRCLGARGTQPQGENRSRPPCTGPVVARRSGKTRGRAGRLRSRRAQEGPQEVRRQGAAEEVALVELAARAGQQRALLGRFHAFGDHFQPQAA